MQKVILILVSCIISLLAQINLKMTSPMIPTNWQTANAMGPTQILLLLMRVGIVSGTSLLMTWFCYRRFGFLELTVAQSVMYFFVILASRFIFNEPITINRVGALVLIFCGIVLFYLPSFSKSMN